MDELCEGVHYPKGITEYIHYFCGENGVDTESYDVFARSREKLYKLVNRLTRAYAELKPRMDEAGYTATEKDKFEERVTFYLNLRDDIGRASGDFLDLKAYEPGMRFLIDNYIVAEDSEKLGRFDDFTLLDFIISQSDNLSEGKDSSSQESAAETIENNIRRKVVEKLTINPAYYSKMSAVLEQLILDRKSGVIKYKELIEKYIELAKNVTVPESNEVYPESVRKSEAMRAFYDNCGEDENLAVALHTAVISVKQEGFRNNPVKENKIKRELYKILKNPDEVERIYKIIVEQEEY